ncbi:MAG: phosphate/phosphite/phosphonate ABC transporter substrate-binding protein [Deltaproteobacteria bacterium]|nr:phosphate/phosphite/phosphonate ABC transporter substrate-binding protein [Candidatus Tharpella aukensis]
MEIVRVSFLKLRGFCFTANFIVVFFLALTINNPSFAQEPLLLGVHPFLPYTKIEEKFAPLAAYLSNELNHPVVVRVGCSYQDHIDSIGRDQLDIAYIGPAPYIAMVKKYGPKPLIVCQVTNGSPFFKGIIIVRNDYPACSLADLGKNEFAFVDRHSTMGYLIPRAMLEQENPPIITKQQYRFLKTHNNVALGVLAGDFEAGAVKEAVYQRFRSAGLKALAATPAIAEHLFVVRSTLAESTINQLRTAMLKLNQDQTKQNVLKSIKTSITGFSLVKDDDYNSLRKILEQMPEKESVK